MVLARWDAKYETGRKNLDEQHQHLFELFNGLHEALTAGAGKELMGPTLNSVAGYAVEHFLTEETLMMKTGYPAIAEHQRKHEEILAQLKRLRADFAEGRLTLPLTLARFLADWLRHHIEEEDLKMVEWVRGRDAA